MSAGEPNSPQKALAKQQHELLTPFNHIIGYCDLLLEDPLILTQSAIVADLQVIRTEGLQALDHLHMGLATSTQAIDLTLVRPQIAALLNQILAQVALLRENATNQGQSDLASDLDRIHGAAERFLTMSAPLAHDPRSADDELIERLQAAIVALETGTFETDLLANLPPRGDKLGQLTLTFQRMMHAVRAREDALKEQITQLQSEASHPHRTTADPLGDLMANALDPASPLARPQVPTESPISATDSLDLSPALNRVLRLVRNRVEMTFPDVCATLGALPEAERMTEGEVTEALESLCERGLLTRSDGEPTVYKTQSKRKARPTQMRDIWDALGVSDKKKPVDGVGDKG